MTKKAIFLLVTLFLINIYVGICKGWGEDFWISAGFHLSGGFLIAMLLFSFYNNDFASLRQYLKILVVIAMTLGVGVVWEFLEFIASQTLVQPLYNFYGRHFYFMGNLADTMSDLLMDTLGAIAFLITYYGLKTKKG